jgi:hypothetical protein
MQREKAMADIDDLKAAFEQAMGALNGLLPISMRDI